MEKKTYKAKVEIIRQGQDGTQMFILEKGQVNVSKVNKALKFREIVVKKGWLLKSLIDKI